MNHVGFIPKQTLKPLSYQPMRAGQFRGFGGCNVFPSNNTIINNNVFGNGMNSGGCCDGGGYGYDNGMSKGEKWMIGGGIASMLLGFIGNMFGGGGGGSKVEAKETTPEKTETTPEVDKDAQKMHDAELELETTLKTLGLDPTKGKVLKDKDGNLSFSYDGIVYDSMDKLREALGKKKEEPVAPAIVTPEEPEPILEEPVIAEPVVATPAPVKRSTVKVPKNWDRIHDNKRNYEKGYAIDNNPNGVQNSKTAADVAQYLLENEQISNLGTKIPFKSKYAEHELAKEIIKYNPSVFNKDGTIKKNANWDKLDLPSVAYLKEMYLGTEEKNKTSNMFSLLGNGSFTQQSKE